MQTRTALAGLVGWRWFAPLVGLVVAVAGVAIGFGHNASTGGLDLDEIVVAVAGGVASFVVLALSGLAVREKRQVLEPAQPLLKPEQESQAPSPQTAGALTELSDRLAGLVSACAASRSLEGFYERATQLVATALDADSALLYWLDDKDRLQLVAAWPVQHTCASVSDGRGFLHDRLDPTDLEPFGLTGTGLRIALADCWLVVIPLGERASVDKALASSVKAQAGAALRMAAALAQPLESSAGTEAFARHIRQVYNSTENPMCLVGPAGDVFLCNESFAERYVPPSDGAELLVPGLEALSCGDSLRDVFARAMSSEGRVGQRMELVCRDGGSRTCYAEARRIQAVGSRADGYVTMMLHDLSERQSLETRLARAARMEGIGQLAGGIAHDFNNILTVINGSAEFALESVAYGQDVTRDLEEILKAGRRAAVLTRQLLAFSRKQAMVIDALNYNDMIHDLLGMLERLIQEDIEMRLQLNPEIGLVRADAGQMQQVLMNLVVNARDAIGSGGVITIETDNVVLDKAFCKEHFGAEPGPMVRLSVRDTGCGMSPEVLERVFEPFFTTKGPEKGTGLGLASVFGIIKQLGGNVYASSKPGIGSSFDVYLPCIHEESQANSSGNNLRDRQDACSARILVVEDQEQVREMTVQMLSAIGYEAIGAENAQEALELVTAPSRVDVRTRAQCPIDLLITDVVMPGLSGVELVTRVRQVFPDVAVMYMSGHGRELITRDIGDIEDAFLLPKPFALGDLQAGVELSLRRKHLSQVEGMAN